MKKLGFGMMRLPLTCPDKEEAVNVELTKLMVDAFIKQGFTYFDTAWMYCGFASENVVKTTLVQRHPRQNFTLTTKLHSMFLKSSDDCDKIFNAQLEKTGVDFFDYYLLHDVNSHSIDIYNKFDCWKWLANKKTSGLVKHIGFSYHDGPELLDKVLDEHPEIELVQLQINYLDWNSLGVQSRLCYEVATKHGKPVIVMEPVKGGTLASLPPSIETKMKNYNPNASISSWAIRFAASLPNVMLVLSGMSNMEQMMDNTSYMLDFKPLNDAELKLVEEAVAKLNATIAIPCTGCSYCTDGCPKHIAIPRYFSLYNADLQEIKTKEWTPHQEYYDNLTKTFGKASHCIQCGQCETVCPQHLPIIQHLKEVSQYFEKATL